MIVSIHVATGAAVGTAFRSRFAAITIGPFLHLLADRIPHQDIASRRFEVASGVAGVLLLVARRGPLDPATLGALSSSLPDAEHLLRLPRPGGRKLFPSHRFHGWHRAGGIRAAHQLLLAGAVFGVVMSVNARSTRS